LVFVEDLRDVGVESFFQQRSLAKYN